MDMVSLSGNGALLWLSITMSGDGSAPTASVNVTLAIFSVPIRGIFVEHSL